MIDNLRKVNEELIKLSENNIHELKKQNLIRKILSDPDCFFKIDISFAYSILRDLGIPEDKVKSIYMELID